MCIALSRSTGESSMIRWFRPRCGCGGRIEKVEFYLDPFKCWDRYYVCDACGARAETVAAVRQRARWFPINRHPGPRLRPAHIPIRIRH